VAKFEAFGWHTERIDGHDVAELAGVLRRLRTVADKPKAIIADTVKGKGVSFMEGTSIDSDVEMFRFHSGAPKASEYVAAVEEIERRIAAQLARMGAAPVEVRRVDRPSIAAAAPDTVRLFPAYTEALLAAAKRHANLVALDADLVLDMGLIPFAETHPDRFFECGIAEQDMVSQAGGMARSGLLPVVHSFSCFLSTRPNEQIFNNATEGSKIVYVGGLSGVLPAGPGHSHQSLRDISAVGGIPGLVMVEPCCPGEVGPLLDWCLEQHDGPSFVRLISVPYATGARLPAGYRPSLGVGVELRAGKDATIVTSGLVMVAEALGAAELLAARGRSVGVVNLPWLNRVDGRWIADLAGRTGAIVTLDNHFVAGGQGAAVLAALALAAPPRMPRCLSLGIDRVPPSGRNDEVLATLGLDRTSIADRIEAVIAG
jgi:transketolase